MKILKKFKMLALTLVLGTLIVGCSKTMDIPSNMCNKIYSTNKSQGGTIFIEKTDSGTVLKFQGPSLINPNTSTKDLSSMKDDEEKKKKMEKGESVKEYKNVKIVEKNGKKFLKADNLKYEFEILDEKTILDTEDKEEYIYIDIKK